MHPGMQPGMHPGMQPMMNPAEAELARLRAENAQLKEVSGYQQMSKKFDGMSGVFIKQKINLMELVTGCDMPNRYQVFGMKDGQKVGHPQFEYIERSGCCSRMCLPADCRPLKMTVTSEQYGALTNQEPEVVLEINRPCKCTCYCFNRQEMQVSWVEKGAGGKYLGKIVDPWDCCNFYFHIRDEEDKTIYKIRGKCCQLGIQCSHYPYTPCQTVNFEILAGETDEVVGTLVKTGKGYCASFWADEYNNFKIDFPPKANWKEKALITTAAVFIDFMMFEKGDQKKGAAAG